jgi:hypothetical protein
MMGHGDMINREHDELLVQVNCVMAPSRPSSDDS